MLTINDLELFIENNPHLQISIEQRRIDTEQRIINSILGIENKVDYTEVYKYESCKSLLEYKKQIPKTKELVKSIKEIILRNNTLECEEVQMWCFETKDYFNDELSFFGLMYLDSDENENDVFNIPNIGEPISKNEFISIIQFWEAQWILYWNEYYLPIEERGKNSDEVIDGYYSTPLPVSTPSDLDQIKNILNIGI